ncbi:S41 family peptidase [Qipengyuania sp. 1NDH17]|uniref:S41 family peptidase n=1 Tax=Qipengyuania polymorpha TaxID=2867234 RepID=A0ABS7ITZ3_9SPHN|nr:S41 family peptidase [Qipengyuania polymorpha]MBX7456841.1 S41 family peptidase [Qipengyuania polymorpha]
MTRKLTALFLALPAAACTHVAADSPQAPQYGAPTAIASSEAAQGVWQSRGYGYILDVSADGITRYQYGDTCYATPEETKALSEMAGAEYSLVALADDGRSARFQLLSGDTRVTFDRLDALPDACVRNPDTSPPAVAAAFADHFERHYAFFDRRGPSATQRAARLASLDADSSDEELWQALAGYMEGLSDSHTKLIGVVDGEKRRVQDGQGETLPHIREGIGENKFVVGTIVGALEQLGDSAHHVGNDRVVWGTIDGRVGYISLLVMGGFSDNKDFASEAWAEAELAAFDAIMDEAMTAFAGMDAVIVDLSNNRGGWDRISKALASRFAAAPFTAYTTQAHGSGIAPFAHVVEPASGPTYTGPVYVMTSDITVSGGELATLAMRQLPNVTQLGSTTRGAFSTPLPKPLPNGWLLELSNETFAAADGTVYEETGLAPEIELDIYPAAAPVAGHWQAVEQIVAMATTTD